MEVLTLGRFILEMSLMDYNIIRQKDSLVAASALLLASLKKGQDIWVSVYVVVLKSTVSWGATQYRVIFYIQYRLF